MAGNQQLGSTGDRVDNVRKELDAKIENKVSNQVFYWALSILFFIATAVLSYVFVQIGKISDKMDAASNRITIIETKIKMEERKK